MSRYKRARVSFIVEGVAGERGAPRSCDYSETGHTLRAELFYWVSPKKLPYGILCDYLGDRAPRRHPLR